MAAKQIVFSEDARRKLKNGMTVVANAVSATLGPKGRNVAIDRKFGSPSITHDGVSVAKEIELEDPFENMGAQLLKEAAQKTFGLCHCDRRTQGSRSRLQPHAPQEGH